MTWTIGGITLPLEPFLIEDDEPAVVEVFLTDGGEPVIIIPGLDAASLTIQGSIYVSGYTHAQIVSTYLSPLRALRGKEVAVVSPDGQFDGNWALASFRPRRIAEGSLIRYTYSLKLIKGQAYVIQ